VFENIAKNLLTSFSRASGLGRACVEDICAKGGYVAILDMNEELAQDVVNQIVAGKTKFFEANVLETESITSAVKGALAWSKETGKEIGGVVAAAGVSTPAKVIFISL
jgi:3-hydroxyacyl-CoA dehydrogenase/3-hydroxy-2-methylbutyryl-CoA dehydrogenase